MDDFLEEKKSLDELHAELVLELERLKESAPANLEFSDADLSLYLLDLYQKDIRENHPTLQNTSRMQILDRLRRNLDDQLKLMENREDPDENLWISAANLAKKYLAAQNSHTLA